MPKRVSHSSHEIEIKVSDGQFSFRPPASPDALVTLRGIGEDMLTWASTTESRAAERINEILRLIVELGDLGLEKGYEEEHTFGWQGRVFTAKANVGKGFRPEKSDQEIELASALNHRLRRYKLSPWYWGTVGRYPILGWWSGKNRPKDEDDPGEDVWFTEEDAIIAIIDLAREGLLCKIRRCHCGDWFFAKFAHQKFCCTRCQQAYFRSSEDYKADRRAYMRNLRGQHKKTYLVSPKDRAKKTKMESSHRKSSGASSISQDIQPAK